MKYMIAPLKSRCVEFLLENISVENVVPALRCCLDWDIDNGQLMNVCRQVLRSNIENVLKPPFIATLNEKCFIFLLEDEGLNIAEIDLFTAVIFEFYTKLQWEHCR